MKTHQAAAKPPTAEKMKILSNQLNGLFVQFAEVDFPAPGNNTANMPVTRFCVQADRSLKQQLCDRFRTTDQINRLHFIISLSEIVMPHLREVVTEDAGELKLCHNRPGGTDTFVYPVSSGVIGDIFTESREGTLTMNPFCALLQWIERGENPKGRETGFVATFSPATPKARAPQMATSNGHDTSGTFATT